MSVFLRSTLKFSAKQIYNYTLRNGHSVSTYRSTACFNHVLKNHFQTSAICNANEALERFIKKLDQDARRIGRISLKEVEEVFDEIKSSRSASTTQSLMVIRCCGNLISEESPEKRTQLVQQIWNTFDKIGIQMDISHYNALLKVYLENEHPFVPTDVLAELEEKGFEPNRVTLQRLITRYCQIGDIEGATKILEHMREKEMPVNEHVFNALILGHSNANDMESAEGILCVMKQSGIDPSAEAYTILICGYIKQGNLEKVDNILKQCEDADIYFIDKDYLEVMYNLALNNYDIDKIMAKVKKSTGYNQEAMNYVYRLVSANKIDVAFKLLKSMVKATRIDGSYLPVGGFFVAHLVRNNLPAEDIIKYCDDIMAENLHPFALNVATENSVRFHKVDLALTFFKALKERNLPVRQHFFWPLLTAKGKEKDVKGVLDILSIMSKEYGMHGTTETLRDYVIPYVLSTKPNIPSLLLDFKSVGVPIAASVSSIVSNFLFKNNIVKAAEIAASYKAYYPIFLIRRKLIESYLATSDVESLTTILRQVATGIRWKAQKVESASPAGEEEEEAQSEEETTIPEYRESIGQVILELVKHLKNKPEACHEIERIFQSLLSKGIGIGPRSAESIQNQIQNLLTQELSSLLEKLTETDLSDATASTTTKPISVRDVSEETLERLYESMVEKGEPINSIKKQLFNVYGRNTNLEKLIKLKEDLEKDNFHFSNGMYAYLIDTYVHHGKLEEALGIYSSVVEKEPDFTLNAIKVLRFALLMVENGKFDKAYELLKKKPAEVDTSQPDNVTFVNNSLAWRILNIFAEQGNVEKVHEFFDVIVQNNFTEVTNVLLGPLIKVHVRRDDVASAVKEFERCSLTYRVTPWKSELARIFIEKEDAASLQKLTDLSTQVHGEVNSLYDLMLSFLECGRIRQAKKILETPGLRLRQDRLQNACQKYQNEGAIDHLENLLAVTKDISNIDRSDLYYNLLLSYDKAEQPKKAQGLWMQMQEEDVQPTDPFLVLLASILNKNNIEVPFVVPTVSAVRVQHSDQKQRVSRYSQEFRKLLRINVGKAIDYKQKNPPNRFNNTDLSLLMEAMLKEGKIEEAKSVFRDLANRNVLPITKVLKFYINSVTSNGDVTELETMESRLDSRLKAYTSFENRKCVAHLHAGRIEEYLNKMEKTIDSVKNDNEFAELVRIFPKGGILRVMSEKPDTVTQIRRIAEKCLEMNSKYIGVMNVLWMYQMIQKNFNEADELWKQYFQSSEEPVKFQSILVQARKQADVETLSKLREALENKTGITPKALGLVYGVTAEVLVAKDKVEEAADLINAAVKAISVENIWRGSLETVRAACIAQDIPFRHDIESSRDEEDYSSSDSE